MPSWHGLKVRDLKREMQKLIDEGKGSYDVGVWWGVGKDGVGLTKISVIDSKEVVCLDCG